MATKKNATKKQPELRTVNKPEPIQSDHAKKQIPEHIELIAGEDGIDGALTLLDNMSAMLDVMCNIDREQDSPEPAQLAKVFFVLKQWTDFARAENHDWYNENEAVA